MASAVENSLAHISICEHCQYEVMAEALRVRLFIPGNRSILHHFDEVSLEFICELVMELRRYLLALRAEWTERPRVNPVTTFLVGCWILVVEDAIEEIKYYWQRNADPLIDFLPRLGGFIEELSGLGKTMCREWAMSTEVQELLFAGESRGLLQPRNVDEMQVDQDNLPDLLPGPDSIVEVGDISDRESVAEVDNSSDHESVAEVDNSSDHESITEMDCSLDPEFIPDNSSPGLEPTPDTEDLTSHTNFGLDIPNRLSPMLGHYLDNLEENSDPSPFFWLVLCTIVVYLTIII